MKKDRDVKAGHMAGMEVLIIQRRKKDLPKEIHKDVRGIIKAYEDIIRSLFDVHEEDRIVYAPYGAPDYKSKFLTGYGVEIQIHKCCGIWEDGLRMLNKISNFDDSKYPSTDVNIEACDEPEHQKFSKTLGETFTCTKITIDVDFSDWRNRK